MENKYKAIPFWSWNDELDEKELVNQIDWMHENGIGGFFMHARGGLTTPYLGDKWFSCIEACLKRAKELNMEAYAYDENGWPSGFAGMKLLEDPKNCDCYLTYDFGAYNPESYVSYDISSDRLVRTKKGENCINIYKHTSNSTADILDKNVVKKFIALTHEQYKKHDKYGNLRGFFTDEPQYYRWAHPYTNVLPTYFKEHYELDILDGLGLMFVEKYGYRDFRYKYWKAMQDLMLNSFAKQIYNWCDDNGYKLTGHYVEEQRLASQMMCCGGIMPFYAYEHIPGVDWLCRRQPSLLLSKQVSSVAQQLDKPQVLTETFAMTGWDATPMELKRIADSMYVGGINLMCQHLLPYSEHGQRKRDYPEHFSKINPWADKYFKEFNDHFTYIGEKIATSSEIVNVAVFQTIRSCYFNYKRELEPQRFGISELDDSLANVLETLSQEQINYHLIDETLLAEFGKVEGNSLIVGKCKYDYIVFPLTYTMDKTTEALLKKFCEAGGKVLFTSDKPTYLEGQEYTYDYLKTNSTIDEIKKSQRFSPKSNPNILFSYRKDKDGNEFVFAFNRGKKTTWTINNVTLEDEKGVYFENIEFDEYESKLLHFTNKTPSINKELKPLLLKKEFDIIEKPTNYLLLDFIQYSKDGISYSEPLHYMGIFNELLSQKYKGPIYLKYSFNSKYIPNKCEALIEDTRTKRVLVNDNVVTKSGSILEKDLWKYDIAKYIVIGRNEVVVEIDHFQEDIVYHALFGKNVTESLKNCLAYSTTIEAIYLKGDFGVFGTFEDGKTEDVLIGKDFYLDEQQNHVTSLIKDGFPFFRGEIKLTQKVNCESENMYLNVPERFQTIDVFVNGKNAGLMMFENKLDLSNYLVKGNNDIELHLIVSNRNLLGTHHESVEENFSVGPFSYEKLGTWTNGKSSILRETYSFVKTII